MSVYGNIVSGAGTGIKIAKLAGLASKLPFLTNPWTAAGLAVAELAPILKNALHIGTAHLNANNIVQGVENPFGDAMKQISSKGGSITDLQNAYNTYLQGVKGFQSKGGDNAKVAGQSLTNPSLWNTFNTLWGQLGGGTPPTPGTDLNTLSTNNSGNINSGSTGDSSNFDINDLSKSLGGNMGFGDLLSLVSNFGNFGGGGTGSDTGTKGFDWGGLLKLGGGVLNAVGGNNSGAGGAGGMGSSPDWMKFLLPILSGGAGALSNRPSTITTTQNPNLPKDAQDLRGNIVSQYQGLLNQDPNLAGYESSGLSQINQGFEDQRKTLEGNLAARGITGPAAETAMQNLENQRFSQGTQFRNQIPLLQTQMKSDILGKAMAGFGGLMPSYGATSTQNLPGNILGGGLTGASQALAMLLGMGAFNKPATAP